MQLHQVVHQDGKRRSGGAEPSCFGQFVRGDGDGVEQIVKAVGRKVAAFGQGGTHDAAHGPARLQVGPLQRLVGFDVGSKEATEGVGTVEHCLRVGLGDVEVEEVSRCS